MGDIQRVSHIATRSGSSTDTVTLAEAAIQQFVHEKADHRIVYTPEVYDSFTVAERGMPNMTYIVMEKVEGENYVDYTKQHPEKTETVLQGIADVARHI